VSIPHWERSEVRAVSSSTENGLPHVLTSIYSNKNILCLISINQTLKEIAISVYIWAPSTTTWRICFNIYPNSSIETLTNTINNSICLSSSWYSKAWEMIDISDETSTFCTSQIGNSIWVDSTIAQVGSHNNKRQATWL